ncbi:ABC-2 type transport system permease protein [Parapedobacter composti]|uniref:ABC-2 type transport system permease protein n=1 Tax=Parapedobacter composti TaxID=623281 RepID=A0A1I1JS39_9SPHI|nr:gliding motility-associated ABC transporter substrate-binding protein GldG [Parapedobacter composti]SFC51326.1 ABC-2 type transport system permease protein [Parapedobacter composti]
MLSIYRKEIAAYFNTLTGYLVIGLFLLATGLLLWVFPDTSILAYGYTTIESFFHLSPYLFLFLIPAITMRTIAGERNEGTWELLLTRPVRLWEIVLGKYLGSITIVALALVPTLLYYLSVYRLALPVGNIDSGAVIGSYIGLFLLGGAFAAIGMFASALTRNAIVAFLIALALSFLLFYAFDALSGLQLFSTYAYQVSALGIQAHYEAISRGVLDSRDLAYFLSIATLFLALTQLTLAADRIPRKHAIRQGMAVVAGIILINVLGHGIVSRIDFTAEKRYTLSPLSKQTLASLGAATHVTVFLDGELPAGFTRLKRATTDLLNDLKAHSGGKLTFSFANPLDGDTRQRQENMLALAERGISPTNLNVRTASGFKQQLIVPAALITGEDVEIPVNLLQNRTGASHEQVLNNSVENLEYAFVSALRNVAEGGRPLVGFTEGHGELNNVQLQGAIQALISSYAVGFVNLDSISLADLGQLSALIVAKPTRPFTETEKYKINHFVMEGGSLLWAVDQSTADLDSLRTTGDQIAVAHRLNLDDLLFTYGVRFNYDLIADMNCAQIPLTVGHVGNQTQIELAPWLFYPVLVPDTPHPMLKNLDGIRCEFVGTIDTIAVEGIRKTVILQSSPFSRRLNIPATVSLQLAGETPDPEQFRKKPYPAAVLLEGRFPSVFVNRPVPTGIPASMTTPERGQPAKMVAIADGDVFKGQVNPADNSPYPLGWDRYTEQQYGNRSFLLNVMDYLTNGSEVIALRDKEIKLRLLNQVKVNSEKTFWQTLNVAFPPVLLLCFGILQYYIRKRRYERAIQRRL